MTLNLGIVDVDPVALNISQTPNGGGGVILNLEADWLALDAQGEVVGLIDQKKDSESKLFSTYPADVQSAVLVLRNYVSARVKAKYQI